MKTSTSKILLAGGCHLIPLNQIPARNFLIGECHISDKVLVRLIIHMNRIEIHKRSLSLHVRQMQEIC